MVLTVFKTIKLGFGLQKRHVVLWIYFKRWIFVFVSRSSFPSSIDNRSHDYSHAYCSTMPIKHKGATTKIAILYSIQSSVNTFHAFHFQIPFNLVVFEEDSIIENYTNIQWYMSNVRESDHLVFDPIFTRFTAQPICCRNAKSKTNDKIKSYIWILSNLEYKFEKKSCWSIPNLLFFKKSYFSYHSFCCCCWWK